MSLFVSRFRQDRQMSMIVFLPIFVAVNILILILADMSAIAGERKRPILQTLKSPPSPIQTFTLPDSDETGQFNPVDKEGASKKETLYKKESVGKTKPIRNEAAIEDDEVDDDKVVVSGNPHPSRSLIVPGEKPDFPERDVKVTNTGKPIAEGQGHNGQNKFSDRGEPVAVLPIPKGNPNPDGAVKVPVKPVYITKPAIDNTYNVFVLGDSLGAGLWQGLQQNFRGSSDPIMNIKNESKANTGIVRDDRFNWLEHMEQIVDEADFQIAVMMFGGNDSQTIRTNGKLHHFKTPGWEQHYRKRIDRLVVALNQKDVAIYWVGLPNVRKTSLRENYLHFNEIFREKAEEHGYKFIETWNVTNDAAGDYQAHGKTVNGKKAKLRSKDGTHFTAAGYRRFAQYAEEILRKDVTNVKAEQFSAQGEQEESRKTGADG